MTLVKLEDVLDVISEYMAAQDQVMDTCNPMKKTYDTANIKWRAANQIYCDIYNKLFVHGGEENGTEE